MASVLKLCTPAMLRATLLVPPSSSLRHVRLHGCKNLILPMEDGGGFQSLLSLKSVIIDNCNMLLSRWSTGEAAQGINPFSPQVEGLYLRNEPSTLSMALFSNLTSLTKLRLSDSADLLAEVARTKTMPAGSFQLVKLVVDSISAVLVAPICTRISATLRELGFFNDWRVESFTEEQEQALQLLTSLQQLEFSSCRVLLSIPRGLHCLSSLKIIIISESPRIRSLPKKGLPDSLQELHIDVCFAELYEECQKLRGTRPDINVHVRPYYDKQLVVATLANQS